MVILAVSIIISAVSVVAVTTLFFMAADKLRGGKP